MSWGLSAHERDTYRKLYMEMLEYCRLSNLGLLCGRERETGNDQQASSALKRADARRGGASGAVLQRHSTAGH